MILLKHFSYYKMFFKQFFFFTNLLQSIFSCCCRFCILTKNPNTAGTPTEMKQNLLDQVFSCQGFCQFCQVIKHQSRHESISQSCKISFLTMIASEQKILVLLSRMIMNKLFHVTTTIQLPMFIFKGVKLVKYQTHKLISFIYSKLQEASHWLITLAVFSNRLTQQISKDVF